MFETSPFHFAPQRHFIKRLEKVRRADPTGYEHILKVVERLLSEPDDSDGMLTGPHRGKLKKYVGRSGYRLVYNWCVHCHKQQERMRQECAGCGSQEIPENSVVFLDLFHKSEAARLHYGH